MQTGIYSAQGSIDPSNSFGLPERRPLFVSAFRVLVFESNVFPIILSGFLGADVLSYGFGVSSTDPCKIESDDIQKGESERNVNSTWPSLHNPVPGSAATGGKDIRLT